MSSVVNVLMLCTHTIVVKEQFQCLAEAGGPSSPVKANLCLNEASTIRGELDALSDETASNLNLSTGLSYCSNPLLSNRG